MEITVGIKISVLTDDFVVHSLKVSPHIKVMAQTLIPPWFKYCPDEMNSLFFET